MEIISLTGRTIYKVDDSIYMKTKNSMLLKPAKILTIQKSKNFFFFKTKQKYLVQEISIFSNDKQHKVTKDKLTKL